MEGVPCDRTAGRGCRLRKVGRAGSSCSLCSHAHVPGGRGATGHEAGRLACLEPARLARRRAIASEPSRGWRLKSAGSCPISASALRSPFGAKRVSGVPRRDHPQSDGTSARGAWWGSDSCPDLHARVWPAQRCGGMGPGPWPATCGGSGRTARTASSGPWCGSAHHSMIRCRNSARGLPQRGTMSTEADQLTTTHPPTAFWPSLDLDDPVAHCIACTTTQTFTNKFGAIRRRGARISAPARLRRDRTSTECWAYALVFHLNDRLG